MSKVRRAAQKGDFEAGVRAFHMQRTSLASKERWLGVCLINLQDFPAAELHLNAAFRQGEQGAAVHLATLKFMQGERHTALSALEGVNPHELEADDAALWYRERTRIGWVLGEEREVLFDWAQQAWLLASEAALDTQVSVAIVVGDLYNHYGEHQRALALLDFAAEHAHTKRGEFVQLCRVNAFMALNRFPEAHQALKLITSEAAYLQREIKRIELASAQRDWGAAREAIAALLPQTVGHQPQETWVRTALLTSAIFDHLPVEVDRQLCRLKVIAASPLERAFVDHRAGFWLAQQGQEAGLIRLQSALQVFRGAGHMREATAVLLALAETQPSQRGCYLHQAAELAAERPYGLNLNTEWPLLPEVYQTLCALPADAFERLLLSDQPQEEEVRLHTLGQVKVLHNGVHVKLRFQNAELLLAYLLRKGEVTLASLRDDILPKRSKKTSKNYFHQMRVELAALLPGISIDFVPERQVYQLKCRNALWWDVGEIEQQLAKREMPSGAEHVVQFFSAFDNEWIREERERLRRWVTEVGLETMETWFQTGEYQKCIFLAERLLPLDPLDESLHTFLLSATFKTKGRVAATHKYRESAAIFAKEVGEVPLSLRHLHEQWNALN